MVPLVARKVVHSVGDDMGMEQRPGAGDVLVLHGLASGAELISCVRRMCEPETTVLSNKLATKGAYCYSILFINVLQR
jgi:hypothetical protein